MKTISRPVAPITLGAHVPALLFATLPLYVAFMLVAHAQMPEDSAADLTPGQLGGMEAAWATMHFLWAAPIVLGCLGLWAAAGSFSQGRPAVAVRGLTVAGIAAMIGFYVVELALLGSDADPLGESPVYALGYTLSLLASWVALVATILLCRELVSHRTAVRVAWSVLVLSALYLVLDLLAYLPVLLGPETLAESAIGMPPFLLGIFWAVLAAGLLRTRARTRTR